MLNTKKAKGLAFALAATALVGAVATVGNNASADPKQYDQQIIGTGSDTTQNVMNALAGFENGIWYTPVHGTSNSRTIVSWDATANGLTTTCITTKTGGPAFNRPFGSGAGRTALQSTLVVAGSTRVATTSNSNCGAGQVNISGNVSFARSSSVSGTAALSGTTAAGGNLALENLAYVPFALDALSYGAYRASGGAAITDLTTNELNQIFTTAGGVAITRGANTVTILGCGIQASSGTGTTWLAKIGVTTANTSTCDNLIDPATTAAFGPAAENSGTDLKARGDAAPAGQQVIIGFSVGNFIGQANLVASGGTQPAGVSMGAIVSGTTITLPATASGVSPVLGTAPNLSPNPAYFDPANTFSRLLYNVFPDSVINSANPNAFPDLKQIFKGKLGGATTTQPNNTNPDAVCAQTTTIQKFGFLATPLCGDTSTVKGG